MSKVLEKNMAAGPSVDLTAWKGLLAIIPEPIALLDGGGGMQYVNPAFADLLGYGVGDLLGVPFEDLRVAIGLRAKDGRVVPVDLSVTPIGCGELVLAHDARERTDLSRKLDSARESLDDLGSGVFRMIQDLDRTEGELKGATEKLEETRAQLIQSTKLTALGELSAGVAHEINQPLTVIKGLARNVLRHLHCQGDEREKLELIVEASEKMEAIVGHLRSFARLSGPEHAPLDVNQVVKDAFLMLRELMHKHSIDVTLDLNPVPGVMGSPTRLEQVIINLATNARDAMPEGGTLTVTTERLAGGKDEGVSITVRDTGRGIPADALDRIFEPFFTTKPAGKGTGLGLSISYGIITEHKGTINAESRAGRGATFRITLPAAE